MAYLGLDVGTTGCKAMAFSAAGAPLAHHYYEYQNQAPGQLDPAALASAAFDVVARCAAGCGEPVSAICVSSLGEAFVMLDEKDRPLGPILLYTNRAGEKQVAAMVEKHGEGRFRTVAGVRPTASYSLAKMAWYAEEAPELMARCKSILLVGDYMTWLLSGRRMIDYSLACRTMAFDVLNHRFDAELLGYTGVSPAMMSAPVPGGTLAGPVRAEVAGRLGVPGDCLVVVGCHDQICAAAGAGAYRPGTAVNGIGTVECITPCFASPQMGDAFLDNNYCCIPHLRAGSYATYIYNFTGGALLKWYRDKIQPALARQCRAAGEDFYAHMDAAISQEPGGPFVIPHFAGSGTPEMDPDATGSVVGLTFDTDNAALYRALLEGVCFEMQLNLEIVGGLGIEIGELRATGGGAKSPAWLQMRADITGLPVQALDVSEAGITGCAMLAATATGGFAGLEEAEGAFVKKGQLYTPHPGRGARYRQRFEEYKRLRGQLGGGR